MTVFHCRFNISGVMTIRPSPASTAERNWNSTSNAVAPAGTRTWKANTSTAPRVHSKRVPLARIVKPPVRIQDSPGRQQNEDDRERERQPHVLPDDATCGLGETDELWKTPEIRPKSAT